MEWRIFNIVRGILGFVFGIIEFLLVLRLILRLFDANSAAPFVNWIYTNSYPLIQPFNGIFPNFTTTNGFVLEFSTVFAIIVYAIIYFLIIQILRSLFRLSAPSTSS